MTVYCIVYVDEPTGLLETVATPTADMPVEGVNEEINKRISLLSEDKIKRRGYNKLYMNEVTQADEGVDFQFLK